jgi:ribosomal protein L23
MDQNPAAIRTFVMDLLKKSKALTEREVKAAIGKAFKVNPKTISAGVIRDARKRLGIDRPGAIAFARAMLKKNPVLEAKKVIDAVGSKFGVRLGPPDVSRLRPAGSRRRRAARAASPKAAAAGSGAAAATVRRGRPGRPPKAGRSFGSISVTYQGSGRPEDLAAFFRGLAAS